MGRFSVTVLATMLLLLVFGCENDTPDTEPVKELTCNVTSTNVTTNGGSDGTITINVITGNNNYVYSLNSTNINYNGRFTNLTAGTYLAKVTDSKNKEYTKSVTITEPAIVPVISTVETPTINVVSLNDVTLNGKVNPNGFATTSLYFEYSTSESYTNSTKLTLDNVSGNTLTSVSTKITSGLSYNTTYYVRLVAINAGGTKVSGNITFLVNQPPTINSLSATNITSTSVTLNGKVNPNYQGATEVYFEYGTTTSYGTTSTLSYIDGNTFWDITKNITNLNPNTIYHYRLVAKNDRVTATSDDMTFKTLGVVPTIQSIDTKSYSTTIIRLTGKINPNGNSTNVSIDYGLSTSYGNTLT